MKLLIFSDSHGHAQPMIDAVAAHPDAVAAFFLGDGSRDADALVATYPELTLYRLRGNCDFSSFDPEEGLVPFGGLLIYYTHGHRHDAKAGIGQLLQTAKRSSADIALFGHTHIPYHKQQGGTALFNPGAIAMPRSGPPSYGILCIENGTPQFRHQHF